MYHGHQFVLYPNPEYILLKYTNSYKEKMSIKSSY